MPHTTSLAGLPADALPANDTQSSHAPVLDSSKVIVPFTEHAIYTPVGVKPRSPEAKLLAAETRLGAEFEHFQRNATTIGSSARGFADKVRNMAASAIAATFESHGR